MLGLPVVPALAHDPACLAPLLNECVGVVVKYDTSIRGNHWNATSCKKAGLDGKNDAPGWT